MENVDYLKIKYIQTFSFRQETCFLILYYYYNNNNFSVSLTRLWTINKIIYSLELPVTRGHSSILIHPTGRIWLGKWLILSVFGGLGWGTGGFKGDVLSPWTRNREPRSACNNVLTFCRILWQSDLTSSSLQISFTYTYQCIIRP